MANHPHVDLEDHFKHWVLHIAFGLFWVSMTPVALAESPVGQPITQLFYEIQSSDTRADIERKTGCAWTQIITWNSGLDQKSLKPGETIEYSAGCKGKKRTVQTPVTPCEWTPGQVDRRRLHVEFTRQGFSPPERFMVVVIHSEVKTGPQGSRPLRQQKVFTYGADVEKTNWNPASTVKLYSAAAAAERLHALGYGPDSEVVFHYPEGEIRRTPRQLFHDALHRSTNLAHNRLVQLAGFDHLNGPLGTLRRLGLKKSYVMGAYAKKEWKAQGNASSLRGTPEITLKRDRGLLWLTDRADPKRYACGKAACTTVADLAKMMCKTVLHESLPPDARLRLGGGSEPVSPLLGLLRNCLLGPCDAARQPRALPKSLQRLEGDYFSADKGYRMYRKAGYSLGWRSENLVIHHVAQGQVWTVTMAAYGGKNAKKARGILDPAMGALARLISEKRL